MAKSVNAAHILVNSEKDAQNILARLEKGESFEALAKRFSKCPSKSKGGTLGGFVKGDMVPEFEKAAFALPLDTVSDPVKTQFGWHLIMTTKKTPAVEAKGDTPASPEKVQASHILLMAREAPKVPTKADVEKSMKGGEQQKAMRAYFEDLRNKAKIESEKYPELAVKPGEKPAAAPKPAAQPAKPAAVSKPIEVKPAAKPAAASKPVEAKPAADKK